MKLILVKLLLVSLLFGSVVSSANSACIVFDNQQSSDSVLLDNDEVKDDVNNLTDCCDHYCSCIKQIENCTSIIPINLSNVFLQPEKFDLNLSQFSPPLLRPPIV